MHHRCDWVDEKFQSQIHICYQMSSNIKKETEKLKRKEMKIIIKNVKYKELKNKDLRTRCHWRGFKGIGKNWILPDSIVCLTFPSNLIILLLKFYFKIVSKFWTSILNLLIKFIKVILEKHLWLSLEVFSHQWLILGNRVVCWG